MKTFRNIGTAVLALSILFGGHHLLAQDLGGTGAVRLGPSDRKLGIKAGDFLILPALKIGYSYDSNVFYAGADDVFYLADSDPDKPGSQPAIVHQEIVPGHAMNIGLGLGIRNKNTKNMVLVVDVQGGYDLYLTSNERLKEHSNFNVDAGLKAEFFRNGPISLLIFERFRRILERRNLAVSDSFNRHINRIGGGVNFAPGGKALQIRAGYAFVSDFFTDVSSDWGDLYVHELDLHGFWKFFPFTALVLETNWQIRNYNADDYGNYGELTDNKPLRIRVGLNGFITKKLSLLGLIGYGNSFHETRDDETNVAANDSFNMLIGELRITFQFNKNSVLQGGYRYDFRDSLFANYATYHKVYLNYQQRIAKRLQLELDVGYFHVGFAQVPNDYLHGDKFVTGLMGVTGNNPNLAEGEDDWVRKDHWVIGQIKGSVDVTRWLAFELAYRMELINEPLLDASRRFGACLEYVCDNQKSGKDYIGYQRHSFFGTFVIRY